MTKEEAVAAVEAAFYDAHKSAQQAKIDALQLERAWLKACDTVGVHPNKSGLASSLLGNASRDLSLAIWGLANAHNQANDVRQWAIEKGLLAETKDGGGKKWP